MLVEGRRLEEKHFCKEHEKYQVVKGSEKKFEKIPPPLKE